MQWMKEEGLRRKGGTDTHEGSRSQIICIGTTVNDKITTVLFTLFTYTMVGEASFTTYIAGYTPHTHQDYHRKTGTS